ncbi:MAG TPA: DUF4136 domain-containing protein [Thermoanaerobaculia bacterium]
MKRSTRAKSVALFLTAAFVGCASSVTTSVDYDRSIDFSRYRSYGWLPSRSIGNDILERRLTAAIDRALTARGLARSDTPDLLVAMHGRLSKEVQYTAYDTGWGYGWRRWGGVPTRVTRTEVPVGTLLVDLVDAKDKELVWRGSATTPIDRSASAEKREEAVGEAVEKLFAGFPPKR